jgi:SAM-dependent methyltransferase
LKDLFRREPQRQFADYSSSHLQAGEAYQSRFDIHPGRAVMWQLEKELLGRIFRRLAPRRALDFATGTGRIVAELEAELPDCEFRGIDISEDMLAIARARSSGVIFHGMDGREALDYFTGERFDVVSAFRFFPNADPPLRELAADQIAGLTRPGGHVVLNNHRSFWSIPYLAMRASGNSDGNYGSPNADVKKLFLRRGFSCVRSYSLGAWPQTDFRTALLSWPMTLAVERFNMRHLARMHTLGYNTIFVFKKQR